MLHLQELNNLLKFPPLMNQLLLPLYVMALLIVTGCNNTNTKSGTTDPEVHNHSETTNAIEHAHQEIASTKDSWLEEIELDNGNLWNANPETIEGVENMRRHIQTASLSDAESYRKLGEKLNEEKNYIVRECTMTGASHDNLHMWLHPLIEQISTLSDTPTVEEGNYLVTDIEERLTRFYDYFK